MHLYRLPWSYAAAGSEDRRTTCVQLSRWRFKTQGLTCQAVQILRVVFQHCARRDGPKVKIRRFTGFSGTPRARQAWLQALRLTLLRVKPKDYWKL
jgi:hypothetical protein